MNDSHFSGFLPDGRKLLTLKVTDLKEELRGRGLSISGNKQVLMQRLEQVLTSEESQQRAKAQGPVPECDVAVTPLPSNVALEPRQQVCEPDVITSMETNGHTNLRQEPHDVACTMSEPPALEKGSEPVGKTGSGFLNIQCQNTADPTGPDLPPDDHSPPADPAPDQSAMGDNMPSSGESQIRDGDLPSISESKVGPDSAACSTTDFASKDDKKAECESNPSPNDRVDEEEQSREGKQFETTDTTTTITSGEPEEQPGEEQILDVKVDEDEDEDTTNGTPVEEPKHPRKEQSLDKTDEEKISSGSLPTGPGRKRKWRTTRAGKLSQQVNPVISSDSLKEIVGPIEMKNEDLIEESAPILPEVNEGDSATTSNKRIVVAKEPEELELASEDLQDEPALGQAGEEQGEIKEERKLPPSRPPPRRTTSIFDEPDDGSLRRGRPASPARNPPSTIVHVRGLIRPFTVRMLHELLGRFGVIEKQEFWIDDIKSHCFAKYASTEEATEAQAGLDGIEWPLGTPRTLRVDYASQAELDQYRGVQLSPKLENSKRVSKSPIPGKRVRRGPEKEKQGRRSPEWAERTGQRGSPLPPAQRGLDGRSSREQIWPKNREWDQGKNWGRGQSPPLRRGERMEQQARDRSRSPRRLERNVPPAPPAGPPARLLDELFYKTKSTPSIYWMPLTESAIMERAEMQRMKEEERRQRRR